MSHDIKYVFRVTKPSHRKKIFSLIGEKIEDPKYKWLTDLKIADDDYYPVWKKDDITFRYSSKFDLTYLFSDLISSYPRIDWACDLWDEEIGLCYFAQSKNGVAKGWNIIPDFEQADELTGKGNFSDLLRDDYYL